MVEGSGTSPMTSPVTPLCGAVQANGRIVADVRRSSSGDAMSALSGLRVIRPRSRTKNDQTPEIAIPASCWCEGDFATVVRVRVIVTLPKMPFLACVNAATE